MLSLKDGPLNIFFPFCGKAVDPAWYYQQGHQVYGVECAERPIIEFFEEHSLKRVATTLAENVVLHSTEDKKLQIIEGDFYTAEW